MELIMMKERGYLKGSGTHECMGLAVQWVAGSLWDSYAYQEHDDDDILGWKPNVACRLFYPVAAGVEVHLNHNLIWTYQNSDLVGIIETAMSATNPDSSEILNNIKMLPKVPGPGLPYTLGRMSTVSD